MPQSKTQKRKTALAARRIDVAKHLARPESEFADQKDKDAITQRILREIANIEAKL